MTDLFTLRKAEIEPIKNWFPQGAKVLDVGGGTGYQASLLASWGCEVQSIDLAGRAEPPHVFFPVDDYDGVTFPFEETSFDIVFSSNVLEHVQELDRILAETKRVLTPQGRAVHVLPSATWRLWTSLAHYPYLPRYVFGAGRAPTGMEPVPPLADAVRKRGYLYLLRRALIAGPHGVYPSAASELYFFSRKRWARVFEEGGFVLEHAAGSGLFYTGYGLSRWGIEARRRLARWLGSSCHIFAMRKRG